MKSILIILTVILVIFALGYCMIGDGAFKKKFTLSGIVPIHISEHKTTCFVDSEAHGISCLPDWFIEGRVPINN